MLVHESRKTLLPCPVMIGSPGCSRAPSMEFLGTFFPAWMFCILTAVALTGLIWAGLVRWGLEQKLGPLVVFYPSLATGISCLLWLVLYS